MNTFHYIDISILTFASAGLTACIMIILFKYHVLETYAQNRKTWMPGVCTFCLCYWIGFFILLILKQELKEPMSALEVIVCAMVAATLARKLVSDL